MGTLGFACNGATRTLGPRNAPVIDGGEGGFVHNAWNMRWKQSTPSGPFLPFLSAMVANVREFGYCHAMESSESPALIGTFTVAPGKDVYGELALKGADTSIYLEDKEFFDLHAFAGQHVLGVLRDATKVSLIWCTLLEGLGSGSRANGSYKYARLFPHFVVRGEHHIAPANSCISELRIVIDDATTLFYDFDAFGSLLTPKEVIEQVLRAQGNIIKRSIEVGPEPEVLYFSGKREIAVSDTVLGRVSAKHNPSRTFGGGPQGVSLTNTISVHLVYPAPVKFDDAISNTITLLRFFEIIIGRPQNLTQLTMFSEDNNDRRFFDVYWSMPPRRRVSGPENRPHPADVLINAVREPEVYSKTLSNWLERESDWHEARSRFSSCFSKQRRYDIDRLIACANMFDILPKSAVPSNVELSDELRSAAKDSRQQFLALPRTPESESILNALGRLGKSTLKSKIRYRAAPLIAQTGDLFTDFTSVTDEAVNCRNYYVHGGDARFDYDEKSSLVSFFCNTLEFLFAASDLIEAGWDVKRWAKTATTMSHPFAEYRVEYRNCLAELKAALANRT